MADGADPAADPVAPVTTTLEFSNPRFKPKRESEAVTAPATAESSLLVDDVFASISGTVPVVATPPPGEGEGPWKDDVAEVEAAPSPAPADVSDDGAAQADGSGSRSLPDDEPTAAAAAAAVAAVASEAGGVGAAANNNVISDCDGFGSDSDDGFGDGPGDPAHSNGTEEAEIHCPTPQEEESLLEPAEPNPEPVDPAADAVTETAPEPDTAPEPANTAVDAVTETAPGPNPEPESAVDAAPEPEPEPAADQDEAGTNEAVPAEPEPDPDPAAASILSSKVQALREQYIVDALEDWQEDHPDQDPETSEDWAAERELALSEFEETLEKEDRNDNDNADGDGDGDGDGGPASRRRPSEIAVEVPPSPRPVSMVPGSPEAQASSFTTIEEAEVIADPQISLSAWFRKTDRKGKPSKVDRFFLFHGTQIRYYGKDPAGDPKRLAKPRGTIHLDAKTQVAGLASGTSLIVHTTARTWRLLTDDKQLVEDWTRAVVQVLRWIGTQTEGQLAAAAPAESKLTKKETKQAAKLASRQQKESERLAKEATKQQRAEQSKANHDKDGFKGHAHGGIRQGPGVGGFTRTELSLGPGVTDAVKAAKGKKNLVVLAVDTTSMVLTLCSTATCGLGAGPLGEQLNTREPRYYVLVDGKHVVFVYCCPDDSARKPRMVYSTAKASAIDLVKGCGLTPTVTLEVTEASDLADDDLVPTASSIKKKRKDAVAAAPKETAGFRAAPKAIVADPKAMGGLSAFMATTLGSDNKSGSNRSKKVLIAPHGAH